MTSELSQCVSAFMLYNRPLIGTRSITINITSDQVTEGFKLNANLTHAWRQFRAEWFAQKAAGQNAPGPSVVVVESDSAKETAEREQRLLKAEQSAALAQLLQAVDEITEWLDIEVVPDCLPRIMRDLKTLNQRRIKHLAAHQKKLRAAEDETARAVKTIKSTPTPNVKEFYDRLAKGE